MSSVSHSVRLGGKIGLLLPRFCLVPGALTDGADCTQGTSTGHISLSVANGE